VVVEESDIFCEIVKISYGKGSKNPVSGPTAFYEPKKSPAVAAPSALAAEESAVGGKALAVLEGASAAEGEVEALRRRQEAEMAEQNKRWSVGVVPQGRCTTVSVFHVIWAVECCAL
jgi:hypothetical protein